MKGANHQEYWHSCAFCGASEAKTMTIAKAPIFTDPISSCETLGLNDGFAEEIEPNSHRNFIPLCGTIGDRVSCLHFFDLCMITPCWNPFSQQFYLLTPKPCLEQLTAAGKHILHGKVLNIPRAFYPYRRLLAARAKACAVRHNDEELLTAPNLTISMDAASKASDNKSSNSSSLSSESSLLLARNDTKKRSASQAGLELDEQREQQRAKIRMVGAMQILMETNNASRSGMHESAAYARIANLATLLLFMEVRSAGLAKKRGMKKWSKDAKIRAMATALIMVETRNASWRGVSEGQKQLVHSRIRMLAALLVLARRMSVAGKAKLQKMMMLQMMMRSH